MTLAQSNYEPTAHEIDSRTSILVVDDDEFMLATAREVLESQGFKTFQATSGEEGIRLFTREQPDVVLLDVRMPGLDGYATCRRIRELPEGEFTPILMATGLDDLESIETAYEAGATDFEMKPLQWTVVAHRIGYMLYAARSRAQEAARERRELRRLQAEVRELEFAVKEARLVYRSPKMDDLLRVARRVAPTDATVLVTGESGTGKELMAETLHRLSRRSSGPMITVDCGAIPTTLIESELFGHEKGAYTGAEARRPGRLVEADGGTVFLDEIGELPLEVQSKLLRFVQERHVVPVGSSEPRQVDVRVVAATNRDLQSEVEAGRFREDLYFRLNVVNLTIPPLRERPEDVLLLARHFVERFAVQYQRDVRGLSHEAETALTMHTWPGNVRELQNRVLQAVILSESGELDVQALDLGSITATGPVAVAAAAPENAEDTAPEEAEEFNPLERALDRLIDVAVAIDPKPPIGQWLRDEVVLGSYESVGQRLRPAARVAGLPSSTFRRRLKKAEAGLSESLERVDGWDTVAFEVERLIEKAVQPSEGLDAACEDLLTALLCRRFPGQTKLGALLSGVSAPTYRKRARSV
ncbi:MAG: sigma-54 dependent transcriptional regulator [Acidobacteriota bacterium]